VRSRSPTTAAPSGSRGSSATRSPGPFEPRNPRSPTARHESASSPASRRFRCTTVRGTPPATSPGDRRFQRVVVGVRTVETEDRRFFERVVRETATLLDEEYVDSAVLDWQDAFDAA
jgi:hypothetical protein